MASKTATFVNLVKCSVGTGILTIPAAFTDAGLFGGVVGLLFVAIISIHCMHILVKSSTILCLRNKKPGLQYEEVVEEAFLVGPQSWRNCSHTSKYVVAWFLIVTQFGYCTVYILFVAKNLELFIDSVSQSHFQVSAPLIILVLLPVMALVCFTNRLDRLAIFSSIAIVIQVVGLAVIFYNLFQDMQPLSSRKWEAPLSQAPIFFGVAVSAIEGIAVVLPLHMAMENPSAMGGTFGLLNIGMGVVTMSYVGMGFFGYLKYGDTIKDTITLSLPATALYSSVRLMFAIAIFLSYPLQFYVGFTLIWPVIMNRIFNNVPDKVSHYFEYAFKSFLVALTFFLAAVVPELELVISLAGSLLSTNLGLIFPPIVDFLICWDLRMTDRSRWFLISFKDAVILLVGLFGCVTGTYTSAYAIIVALFQSHPAPAIVISKALGSNSTETSTFNANMQL